ncbi:MAG: DUF819 family protein [Archangiaceae bacterium]|nr:DUF819 family protein [Archangiaceae bacterium]
MSAAQVLLCLFFPAIARWAEKKHRLAAKLGPVVLCYAFGIALGNLPGLSLDRAASLHVSEAAVPLAIPLLLFSTELKAWLALARSLLLCFALACLAAVLAACAVGLLFRAQTDEWWKVAGMLVGVYVGGTANMSAIGLALGAKQETFVLLNAADVVAGGAYLLFLVSVGQRVALTVLPRFTGPTEAEAPSTASAPVAARSTVLAVALAVLLVGLCVSLSFALFGRLEPPLVLLGITSLGIAASLSPRVRGLGGSYEAGEYALLSFCVAVGSLADVRLLGGNSPTLMVFVFVVMAASILLHAALAALFRLDADTTLITSTATIFGPAFIGPVAAALKNRRLVAPGLTMGLMGIALGTYLGLATAWLLQRL